MPPDPEIGMHRTSRNSRGFTLSWNNLSYSVNGRNQPILQNLNGIVYPGSVTAVLGASGAGKSTFLDALAGRLNTKSLSGEILINGRSDIPIRHASRYCTQEEALFGNLTVYETLMYAAHFNLPKSTNRRTKVAVVHELIQEFGLKEVKNTIIGTPLLKGCSGGQVRRVSVASQIIGLRSGILFLDEPTSGLDSVAAGAIIKCIRDFAEKEHATVIATIHQPSTETFELFTHLLLLGQGSTVYFGPRDAAVEYFERTGHPIQVRANPSDVYLQMTNVDFVIDQEQGKDRVVALCSSFRASAEHSMIMDDIEKIKQETNSNFQGTVGYVNGFAYQTRILMSRAFLNALKNPLSYWIRVAMYVILAVLMGTTWYRMDDAQATVADRLAALFFAVAFLSFMSVAGIPAFLEERHVFLRECANGLYGVESYVLSNLLVSIPFILIITLSFSLVAYFLMGLQETTTKFFIFIAYLFLALMIAEAQTVFISVAIPIFVGALAITAFTNGLWMVVQGFFVQKKNIPAFWQQSFHQVDFQKYAYELILTNELTELEFKCDERENGCACIFPSNSGNATATNCNFTGEDVLAYYEYFDVSYQEWTLYLFAIFAVFKLATYLVLKITTTWKSRTGWLC